MERKNKVLGLRKKKEAQREAWAMNLSKRWYPRKPKRGGRQKLGQVAWDPLESRGSSRNARKN